jgi:RNA polymerase sigma-70 factor (ECF subfamily)
VDKEAQRQLEQRIQQRLDLREIEEAARVVVEGYGPEIFGYLLRSMRNDDDAAEVFSQFCEDLCRGLGTFQRRSSCRTWLYRVATIARARFWKDPYRRRGQRLQTDEISKLEQEVRASTLAYLRGEVKDRYLQLLEALDADERTLLTLRAEKEMSWPEIAEVHAGPDEALSDKELLSSAAALRQRYKRLKDKIRSLAQDEGLLQES